MSERDDLRSVVVAIPTFRRLALLETLLTSLTPGLDASGVQILIGDNDCASDVVDLVAKFQARGVQIHYLPVSDRGVAQVRNALIAEASRRWPSWRWIAMLDDDGIADATWLRTLIACGERFDAHLVGGPVLGVLPDNATALARNSIFASRRRWPTGPVDTLNTTQNLAISRRCIDLLSTPLFDRRYGASGGEDYDLFRRTARAGGRIVWCDEAEVTEPAPPERLTRRGLLHRYYTTGLYMSIIDAVYDGSSATWLVGVKGLARSVVDVLVGVVRGADDQTAQAVLGAAHHVGRIAGSAGLLSRRYG
jgi:glycosyltransferase involved in cell wall biosynthesis